MITCRLEGLFLLIMADKSIRYSHLLSHNHYNEFFFFLFDLEMQSTDSALKHRCKGWTTSISTGWMPHRVHIIWKLVNCLRNLSSTDREGAHIILQLIHAKHIRHLSLAVLASLLCCELFLALAVKVSKTIFRLCCYISYVTLSWCMHSLLPANISEAPCGLNVTRMLIPADRINLQSAQQAESKMIERAIRILCCSPEQQPRRNSCRSIVAS